MSIIRFAVLAAAFASTAFAQSFVLPVPGQDARYSEGDIVPIQWSTPYASTNIQLFQGPQADGNYIYTPLVSGAPISQNSFMWTAGTLPSGSLDRQAFFFRLSNAEERNGPFVDSANVLIQPAAAAAAQSSALSAAVFATLTSSRTTMMTMQTSTVSSSASTATSTGASSTGASSTGASSSSSASAGPTAAGVPPAVASTAAEGAGATPVANPYDTHYTSSFIGVGVGLGVPALLVAIAAAVILIRKRKASEREKRLSRNDPTAPATTQPSPNGLNGSGGAALASGALGGAAAAGTGAAARESAISHPGSYLTAQEKTSSDLSARGGAGGYLSEKTSNNNGDLMAQYPNQNQNQNNLSAPAPTINTHRRPSNDVWLPQRPSAAEQRGGSSLPFR